MRMIISFTYEKIFYLVYLGENGIVFFIISLSNWLISHHKLKERPTAWNRYFSIESFWNSTLRYECDEMFSDECEFAARAEGEWCNHTCQENVFHTSIVRNFILRGVKMRIPEREACVKPHLQTRSDIKFYTWHGKATISTHATRGPAA